MCLIALTWALTVRAAERVPPEVKAAMDELWRRGRCVLSSIVVPAQRASRVPGNLAGAKVLDGRAVARRGSFSCFAVHNDTMWLATDARLDKVDLVARKRVASFTPADGLPDSPIERLVVDGKLLWIVTRVGLGMLDTATNRFSSPALPAIRVARVATTPQAVWVVADSGTFALERANGAWHKLPALPVARLISAKLNQGIWRVRWGSATSRMIEDVALAGGKLWALAMGTLSRLDCQDARSGKASWRQVSADVWAIKAEGDKVWALTSKGVACYHGKTGNVEHYTSKDGLAAGRHQFLALTDQAVWVATEPAPDAKHTSYVGGGLSRFDKAKATWSTLTTINGLPATRTTYLGKQQGQLWAASLDFDKLLTLSAHPGMMHNKRAVPNVTGLALHCYRPDEKGWRSIRCPLPEGHQRYILGQRGKVHRGRLLPKSIVGLGVGERSITCVFEMLPLSFYGGYCHSIGAFARRQSRAARWAANIQDLASQVGLEGEQPQLLLVSESHGKRVVFAEGQPRVLHLGVHAGRTWALSETALACETNTPGKWHKVIENRSRFYWEAAAAAADAKHLWIGGDAGTISRLDKKSLRCEVVACLSGRKITQLALDSQGRLWVRSSPMKSVLPQDLKHLPKVDSKGLAVYDGRAWREARAAEKFPAEQTRRRYQWFCRGKDSFLFRRERGAASEERHAFLRGVFKPAVLCHDGDGKGLWLKIHEGILRISLSEHPH